MLDGIYLDHLATTPLDSRVLAVMLPILSGAPGNPHATSHRFGEAARQVVEKARAQVATALAVRTEAVVFTPSATAANNLAVMGIAQARERHGRHVLVSAIEHPAVLEAAWELERRGFDVEVIPVTPGGLVTPQAVAERLRPGTTLVCVMAINNEVGTIQPLAAIAELLKSSKALLHCDAAQAPGKIALAALHLADTVALSGHKANGPCGAAALLIGRRRPVAPKPILFGGGQEGGLWPGTLNVAAIAGFGEAMSLAAAEWQTDLQRLEPLAERLSQGCMRLFPGTIRNGDVAALVPHCVSLCFAGIKGETLMALLAEAGVAASFGSACASMKGRPSHVLTAMGLSPQRARQSIRFGLGRFTTSHDIDRTLAILERIAKTGS